MHARVLMWVLAKVHVLACARESLRECAGSVETTSTVWPSCASLTAREAERLVLPTPPLPLIMMYLRWVPATSSENAVVTRSVEAAVVAVEDCMVHAEGPHGAAEAVRGAAVSTPRSMSSCSWGCLCAWACLHLSPAGQGLASPADQLLGRGPMQPCFAASPWGAGGEQGAEPMGARSRLWAQFACCARRNTRLKGLLSCGRPRSRSLHPSAPAWGLLDVLRAREASFQWIDRLREPAGPRNILAQLFECELAQIWQTRLSQHLHVATSPHPRSDHKTADPMSLNFGIFFVNQSYPIYSTNFLQADPTHWVSARRAGACKYACKHACMCASFCRPSFTPLRAWQVLDVCMTVQPNYWDLKEISLFLMAPNSLDPSMGLGLYLKIGASEWLYRGCVHNAHPTEVMPLQVSRLECRLGGYLFLSAPERPLGRGRPSHLY
jgi:hypothetical protein